MGNRGIIVWETKDGFENNPALYLHWHGSPENVIALLSYCDMKKYRKPDEDGYGFARFTQAVTNYINKDDGLSVGIDICKKFHIADNGLYICKGWQISKMVDYTGTMTFFRKLSNDKYDYILNEINKINMHMPVINQMDPADISAMWEKISEHFIE